jgi:hypothetical protein
VISKSQILRHGDFRASATGARSVASPAALVTEPLVRRLVVRFSNDNSPISLNSPLGSSRRSMRVTGVRFTVMRPDFLAAGVFPSRPFTARDPMPDGEKTTGFGTFNGLAARLEAFPATFLGLLVFFFSIGSSGGVGMRRRDQSGWTPHENFEAPYLHVKKPAIHFREMVV